MTLPTFANRIGCVSSTPGTSDLVLAATAQTGYRDRSNLVNAGIYNYSIRNSAGAIWEDGFGTWNSGTNTLTRATVYDSSAGGTTKATLAGDSFVLVGNLLAADIANIGGITSGTYTPTVNFNGNAVGVTYNTQSGAWAQLANGMVVVALAISLSSKGSSTGTAYFTLPVAVVGVGSSDNPMTVVWGQITWGIDVGHVAMAYAGNSKGYLYAANGNSGGGTALTDANFANNSLLLISGCYQG